MAIVTGSLHSWRCIERLYAFWAISLSSKEQGLPLVQIAVCLLRWYAILAICPNAVIRLGEKGLKDRCAKYQEIAREEGA